MSAFEKLALCTRGATLSVGTAFYGWFLVNWMGEQNLEHWSAGSQFHFAMGVILWLVAFGFAIGSVLAEDATELGQLTLASGLLASVPIAYITLFIGWIDMVPTTVHNHDVNGWIVLPILGMVAYSVIALWWSMYILGDTGII